MGRVYNFSAGPAVLPEEVIRQAQEDLFDYKGCGMSVMEMSHRSKVFEEIINTAEADLRELAGMAYLVARRRYGRDRRVVVHRRRKRYRVGARVEVVGAFLAPIDAHAADPMG